MASSSSADPCQGTSKHGPLDAYSQDVKQAINSVGAEDLPEQMTKLLPEVLPLLIPELGINEVLSLRLVSHSWKSAVDSDLISTWDSKGMSPTHLPFICLTGPKQLEAFRVAVGPLRHPQLDLIPFELRIGFGSQRDDLLSRTNQTWEDAVTNIFWDSFFDLCQRIGNRFTALALHLKVHDKTIQSVAERTCRMMMNCLKQMPNLECLSITTVSVQMDNMLANYYDTLKTKGHLKKRHTKLPELPKLKMFELVTLGQTEKSRLLDYFLEQHGSSLKKLRVVFSIEQLESFAAAEAIKGAEDVEELSLEVVDPCKIRGVEPILEKLPNVLVKPVALKKLKVTLGWDWRACDVLGLMRWMGKHFGDCELTTLNLESWQDSLDDTTGLEDITGWMGFSSDEEDDEEEDDEEGYDEDDEEDEYTTSEEEEEENEDAWLHWDEADAFFHVRNRWKQYHKEKKLLERKGNQAVCFEEEIDQLKMPKVKNMLLTTEYKGSWLWLKAFPKDTLTKLETVCRMDPQVIERARKKWDLWLIVVNGMKKNSVKICELVMSPKLHVDMMIRPVAGDKMLQRIWKRYFEECLENRSVVKKGEIKREEMLVKYATGELKHPYYSSTDMNSDCVIL